MSQLQDRIAQFRKMANDDPDNELGHYRLGQLLMEDKQYGEAIQAFRRTLEISPQFSKVYQLLATSQLNNGQRDEALATLRQGFDVADERGDNMPREEMSRMLVELGEPAPTSKRAAATAGGPASDGGFRCQRMMCTAGARAHQLPKPPMNDELGKHIYEKICADCWTSWLRDYSIKVINELRLDLSTERGQEEYDRYMREFFGLEEQSAMNELEYLVSYGLAGDFGRFRSLTPLACRRGQRVVVRSHRGVEVGSVLRPATARHATYLPNTTLGQLLRAVTLADEGELDAVRERSRRLFARSVELVQELELPLEVLDVEVLLDDAHAALQLLRRADCDVRPFVAALSREFQLHVHITDLSRPKEEEEEDHGCGREGCGSDGGCGSCGTGGGCSSCGTEKAVEQTAHFAKLRGQMESQRVGLL